LHDLLGEEGVPRRALADAVRELTERAVRAEEVQ
jgi:hypothetical protein